MGMIISEMRQHNPIFDLINALLGAILSILAAYLLIVGYLVKNEVFRSTGGSISVPDLLIGAPVYSLVHLVGWLIPVGLAVGFVLPRLVQGTTRRRALVYGVLTGVVVGLVYAGAVAHDFAMGTMAANRTAGPTWWERFTWEFVSSAPLMIFYSAIWTCGYVFITHRDGET